MFGALLKLVGWLLLAAWRFASGELLRGYGPYDGGFFHEAPEHTGGWVGRTYRVPHSRWARMAGYRRAFWRLSVLVALVAFTVHPAITVAGVAGVGAFMVWRAVRRARERSYVRNVLEPVWDAIGPILGVDGDADPREWLAIPHDPTDPDARVVVGMPTWFHASRESMAKIAAIVNDRIPAGPWVLRKTQRRAEFRHASPQLQPIWAAIAPLMGMDPLLSPAEDYLTLPVEDAAGEDIDAESRRVRLVLPDGFRPADTEVWRRISDTIVHRVPGGPWEENSSYGDYLAEWRQVPKPPRRLDWNEIAPAVGGSIHEIPVGVAARHKVVKVSMLSESPHWFVTAGTGRGKTSTLRIPLTWVRERGGLVDIIDLKRASFVELVGVSGVRMHTDMESAVWAFGEFYVSMAATFMAIEAGTLKAGDVPPRYLVIDEFGSLMDIARQWWRLRGGKGDPPFLLAWKVIGYQGRQANHRMIVGVHSPTAQLFGGSVGKDLFATRILQGAPSIQKWLMTFGDAPKVKYDASIDGRGVIGYGASAVEEIQVGWLSGEDARARLEASPPAPAWFDRRELPPWVTQAALDAAAADVGIDWLSRTGTDAEQPPADAEPQQGVPGTSTRSRTSAHRPTLRIVHGGSRVPPPPDDAPAPADVEDQDDDVVVGLAAAAHTIGTTPEAFRKARARWRERHDGAGLPGETRRGNQVAFHRLELIRWHAGREIAGRDLRGNH